MGQVPSTLLWFAFANRAIFTHATLARTTAFADGGQLKIQDGLLELQPEHREASKPHRPTTGGPQDAPMTTSCCWSAHHDIRLMAQKNPGSIRSLLRMAARVLG